MVQPITRLSNIQPFQYTFAVDLGRTWEGTPSTLLQECNSITARNQPLNCHQLCTKEHGALGEAEMLKCRERKRRQWECCDTAIFTAGANARALDTDVFSHGKVPANIMDGILGSYDNLLWAERRLDNPTGYISASEYVNPTVQLV
jgi:hypothetical protein